VLGFSVLFGMLAAKAVRDLVTDRASFANLLRPPSKIKIQRYSKMHFKRLKRNVRDDEIDI